MRKHASSSRWGVITVVIAFCTILVFIPNALPILFSSNFFFIIIFFLFGIFTLAVVLLIFFHKQRLKRIQALSIIDSDTMTGVEFERYIGEILSFQGFSVTYTPYSGDFGVDIVAMKNTEKYAIQIKRYKHSVGREAISDAVSGMKYYNCTMCMVITNNYFSQAAKELAKATNCILINRDKLIVWIVNFKKTKV